MLNENHLMRKIPTPRSIGMGSYNMDSHNVQRYVDNDGFVRNEGDVQVNPRMSEEVLKFINPIFNNSDLEEVI